MGLYPKRLLNTADGQTVMGTHDENVDISHHLRENYEDDSSFGLPEDEDEEEESKHINNVNIISKLD